MSFSNAIDCLLKISAYIDIRPDVVARFINTFICSVVSLLTDPH